ncbi:MAG TPA: hypothetical protein VEH04_17095 [Verrucomicrobiae bacterium]|nr:hypothetical protein [Verrucomicrobiae bacterium]
MKKLIALAGYAGAGKDEAAKPLIEAGFERRCFGDSIKAQVDDLVKKHLGFSAFTEDRSLKPLIRRTLESWGEDNYDNIFREFFANLPDRCVNTRLVRVKEAEEWVRQGGLIVEIRRPGVGPATKWEREQLVYLRMKRFVHTVVENDGTAADLHDKMRELCGL